MQPTTQVPETALQAQARIQREKAEQALVTAERDYFQAEAIHEDEARNLPSYAEMQKLRIKMRWAQLQLDRALQSEDQVNGTNYFRNQAMPEDAA